MFTSRKWSTLKRNRLQVRQLIEQSDLQLESILSDDEDNDPDSQDL